MGFNSGFKGLNTKGKKLPAVERKLCFYVQTKLISLQNTSYIPIAETILPVSDAISCTLQFIYMPTHS